MSKPHWGFSSANAMWLPCLDNWLATEFRLHRIEAAIKATATAGASSPGRRRSRAGAHDR